MDTSIIELRQSDSTTVITDGSYEVLLQKPILMTNGSQLSVSKAFIDTRVSNSADDGRVHIDDSNDVFSMNFIMYLVNYTNAGNYATDFGFSDKVGFTNSHPDGRKYIVGLRDTTAPTGLKCTGFQLDYQKGLAKGATVSTTLGYTDLSGKANTVPIYIVNPASGNGTALVYTDNTTKTFSLTYKSPEGQTVFYSLDFSFPEQDRLTKLGYRIVFGGAKVTDNVVQGFSAPFGGTNAIHPYECNITFTIPQASYQPSALAKLITDNMSAQILKQTQAKPINPLTTIPTFEPYVDTDFGDATLYVNTYPTKNPVFTSHRQLLDDDDFGYDAQPNVIFVAQDGNSVLQMSAGSTDNYLLGSSQCALIYDPELNKYVFQQIHSPIISDNTDSIIQRQGKDANSFFTAAANSGIAFTSAGDPKTQKLLTVDMGFDNDLFVVKKTLDAVDYGDIGDGAVLYTSYEVIMDVGKNITENLKSIDGFFVKEDADFFKIPLALTERIITSNNLSSIVGNFTEGGGQPGELANGYFLIEISGLPSQELVTSHNKNIINQKIKSIVGRFYATSDYTTDEGQGSIPYVHNGEPQYIDKLRVRILSPDGDPAPDIKSDNTIFLQLSKPRA
jgi:hypothetical protein